MQKHFIFVMFLTTLGIESVVSPGSDEEETVESTEVTLPIEVHRYEIPRGMADDEVDAIRQQVLRISNLYRRKHGLQTFILDTNINYHAQEWANGLAMISEIRGRSKDENDQYGENIYMAAASPKIGEEAVRTWYYELRFVKEDDGDEELDNNPHGIGHMTQLLWKANFQMGVGAAKADDGSYIIVANYNPNGTVYTSLRKNLPPFLQKDINDAKSANSASWYFGSTQIIL